MDEDHDIALTTDDLDELAVGLQHRLDQISTYHDASVPTILQWLIRAQLGHLRQELKLNPAMDPGRCKKLLWDSLPYDLKALEAFLEVLERDVEGDERNDVNTWRVQHVRQLRRRKALLGVDEVQLDQLFASGSGMADDDDDLDYFLTEAFADEIPLLAPRTAGRMSLRELHANGTSIVLGPTESGKTFICRFLARHILQGTTHRLLVVHCGNRDPYLLELQSRFGERMRLLDSAQLQLDLFSEFFDFPPSSDGTPAAPTRAFVLFDHDRDSELAVRRIIERLQQLLAHCLEQWAAYGIVCKLFFDSVLFANLGSRERDAMALAPIYTIEAWTFELLIKLFDRRIQVVFEREYEQRQGRPLTSAERHFLRQDGRKPNELAFMLRELKRDELERRVGGRPGRFFKLMRDLFFMHALSNDDPDDAISPRLLQQL